MGELGKRVLEKIKEEKIEPKPRWHFLLKNYIFWLAFFLSVVIGALAFCVILTLFFDNDWDIYKYLGLSPLQYILISLPYFWAIALILFSTLAYFYYRRTERGYCCGAFLVVFASIAASVLLGIFFHLTGLGRTIDHTFSEKYPFYEKILCCNHRRDIWNQPERGLLGGKYLEEKNPEIFLLEDFGGEIWEVEEDEDIIFKNNLILRRMDLIKIIGEKKKERLFHAFEIRPW